MGYLPIFIDVSGRPCLVVGGGEVAARKVEALAEAGARVTVVSPRLSSLMETLIVRGLAVHVAREYRRGDIHGCVLAYAATDDPGLHRELAAEARALGIPLNVVDVPELCTFIVPAVVKRGALQIAISTAGASPAFAARLRHELEDQFGPEYALTLDVLRAARQRWHAGEIDPVERMRRLKELANSALPEAIAAGDVAAIERILATHLGDGVGLAVLGLARAMEIAH